MTATQPGPAGSPVSADVAELDRALTRIAYLLTRNRRNSLAYDAGQGREQQAADSDHEE